LSRTDLDKQAIAARTASLLGGSFHSLELALFWLLALFVVLLTVIALTHDLLLLHAMVQSLTGYSTRVIGAKRRACRHLRYESRQAVVRSATRSHHATPPKNSGREGGADFLNVQKALSGVQNYVKQFVVR
jgi:hypothetical protein